MLGPHLRRIRREKELTQEQVSLASGVDRAYLSEVERDQKTPSVDVLMRLCKALGESAGILVGQLEGLELGIKSAAERHEPSKAQAPGAAKLVYDENGILTKIIDERGRELVAGFSWVDPPIERSDEEAIGFGKGKTRAALSQSPKRKK